MGQYYNIAFKREGDATPTVNDRKYKGSDYVMAKLMEHGYLETNICQAVACMLADGKTRLAWVGDYAADGELRKITAGDLNYNMVWCDHDHLHLHEFNEYKFDYNGKFLVNHTKGVYISFDAWMKTHYKAGWCTICPFVILTAVGNGRGGGDYHGTNEDRAGAWAWDELSIEDTPPEGFVLDDFDSFQYE